MDYRRSPAPQRRDAYMQVRAACDWALRERTFPASSIDRQTQRVSSCPNDAVVPEHQQEVAQATEAAAQIVVQNRRSIMRKTILALSMLGAFAATTAQAVPTYDKREVSFSCLAS